MRISYIVISCLYVHLSSSWFTQQRSQAELQATATGHPVAATVSTCRALVAADARRARFPHATGIFQVLSLYPFQIFPACSLRNECPQGLCFPAYWSLIAVRSQPCARCRIGLDTGNWRILLRPRSCEVRGASALGCTVLATHQKQTMNTSEAETTETLRIYNI